MLKMGIFSSNIKYVLNGQYNYAVNMAYKNHT